MNKKLLQITLVILGAIPLITGTLTLVHKCRETPCNGRTLILDYAYPGQSRLVKQQVVDMAR
jgi:hypothetical protein